eukprot:TRINITY_DN1895_c0_g2_i4.p1 TRINITY_DN1895_c0_g2~~TRINITY_DN1895_c0_g2_i4.p1  ORF type:complete len:406 (-),score=71.79 TRINITY_DN1895_c0_g2_i4:1126-2343(-)
MTSLRQSLLFPRLVLIRTGRQFNTTTTQNLKRNKGDPKREVKPPLFWKKLEHQQVFFDSLETRLELKSKDDWYKVTLSRITKYGGGSIMNSYQNSLSRALSNIYPEHAWKPFLFRNSPQGYWNSSQNRRDFLNWIGIEIGVSSLDDWYTIKQKDIYKKYRLGGMLSHHRGSLVVALLSLFPEKAWDLFKFPRLPKDFWSSVENQRSYMESLRNSLGMNDLTDWYTEPRVNTQLPRLRPLLARHNYSLVKALSAIYPEQKWHLHRFKVVPRGYWNDLSNQRAFFESLGSELGFSSPENWYQIDLKTVIDWGGGRLMEKYGNSPYKAVSMIFPEHNWKPYKFRVMPRSCMRDDHTLFSFLEDIKEKLYIQNVQDWKRVSGSQISKFGGKELISSYGGWLKVHSSQYS